MRRFLVLLLPLIMLLAWLTFPSFKEKAPDVAFTSITGKKILLKEYKGNPVLLAFWATDCPSCIKEIPDLIKFYNRYHIQGLELIAINMYYDVPSHVVAMTERLHLPYTVVLDLRNELAAAFGNVQLTPTHILIDQNGFIDQREIGLFKFNSFEKRVTELLDPAQSSIDSNRKYSTLFKFYN